LTLAENSVLGSFFIIRYLPIVLVEEEKIKHWIDHFYGYGSWHAKFWFVADEESGGDVPEEVADKINYLYKTSAPNDEGMLFDVRDLFRHVAFQVEGPRAELFTNLYDYRFGTNAVQNSIWKNLTAFTHGYQNKSLPDLLAYQQQKFAMPSAKTEAVINLYPLPAHNHAWYYSWLDLPQLGFLKSRTLYQKHVYQRRMDTILSNMREYKPELVLMYGMDNINALKKSVQEFVPDAKFKMIKAIKQQIPQHHLCEINGTKMLITTQIPALRHNRIETGFDWEAFGKSMSSTTADQS
jgi:hypothetical protein